MTAKKGKINTFARVSADKYFTDWEERKTSSIDSSYWEKANFSHNEWILKTNESNSIFALNNNRKSDRCQIKFNNGFLIGTDFGEWKGKLYWAKNKISDDAQIGPLNIEKIMDNTKIELIDKNIHGILERDGFAYCIAGLSHLTINEGFIYQVDNMLDIKLLYNLESAPSCFTIDENKTIFIVTTKYLFKLNQNNKLEKMIDISFTQTLYPNSIIISPEKNIYIGMRAGILKISTTKPYKLKWFTKT